MDAVLFQGSDYPVDNVFGQLRTDVKALQLGVVTPGATDGAPGHKDRCSDARPVCQVIVYDACDSHFKDTSTPFVCWVRAWTSACLPALNARR